MSWTCCEGTGREAVEVQLQSFSASVLDGGEWSTARSGLFTLPLLQTITVATEVEARLVVELVWTCSEVGKSPIGIQTPVRPGSTYHHTPVRKRMLCPNIQSAFRCGTFTTDRKTWLLWCFQKRLHFPAAAAALLVFRGDHQQN